MSTPTPPITGPQIVASEQPDPQPTYTIAPWIATHTYAKGDVVSNATGTWFVSKWDANINCPLPEDGSRENLNWRPFDCWPKIEPVIGKDSYWPLNDPALFTPVPIPGDAGKELLEAIRELRDEVRGLRSAMEAGTIATTIDASQLSFPIIKV